MISVDLSLNFITEVSYRIAFLSSVTLLDLSKNNIARLRDHDRDPVAPKQTENSVLQQPECEDDDVGAAVGGRNIVSLR